MAKASIPVNQLQRVIQSFNGNPFSTYDFVQRMRRRFPQTWHQLENAYGAGGQGAGTYYSAYSRTAQSLDTIARRGGMSKLGYTPAPRGGVIQSSRIGKRNKTIFI